MPKPPANPDPYKWTLDLPPGPQCSVGWSSNEIVEDTGVVSLGRENEDRYYTCNFHSKIQLYMVLDGHDGSKACEFVQKFLPSVLLRSELDGSEDVIIRALRFAFQSTEREFFLKIDPHITRKITLQIEMTQKAHNSAEALKLFPEQVEEIHRLDCQIKGGTTVVLALIYNNFLHIANVGDSRALLCHHTDSGGLRIEQLSMDHNTSNEIELRRLSNCGLDPIQLRRMKRLGIQQNTRSIGDYSIKGGFKDIDIISHATKEPGTAEPHTTRAVNVSDVNGFLILMSDGLYDAYEAWTKRPAMVNEDIAHLVAKEMKNATELHSVAQNVVEKVKHLFHTTCKKDQKSGRLDDITLIIRNFGFPLATAPPTSSQSSVHPYTTMHTTTAREIPGHMNRSASENPFFSGYSEQRAHQQPSNQHYQQNPDAQYYSIQPVQVPPRAGGGGAVRNQTSYHHQPQQQPHDFNPSVGFDNQQQTHHREPTDMQRVSSGPLDDPRSSYRDPNQPPYRTNPHYLTTPPGSASGGPPMYLYGHQSPPDFHHSGVSEPGYHYPSPPSSSGYDRKHGTWDQTPLPHTSTPASTQSPATSSSHTTPTRHPAAHMTNSTPTTTTIPAGSGSPAAIANHDYVNVTNALREGRNRPLTNASPLYSSATLPRVKREYSPPDYENVTLKPETKPPKRYSDSQLEEKMQGLQFQSSGSVSSKDRIENLPSGSETRPTTLLDKEQGSRQRPKSADPATNTSMVTDKHSTTTGKDSQPGTGDEGAADLTDEELYGWTLNTPTPSQPNSLASQANSMATASSQPSTLTASSQSSIEQDPLPNKEDGEKASNGSQSQGAEGGNDDDTDSDSDSDEYQNFSADISGDILDCSEASDSDSGDSVDDGKIKCYAVFAHNKFVDWSWDDIEV